MDALGRTQSAYSLASFRYDLSKLRAKDSSKESRIRYQLVGKGYSICEKVYASLTAGLLAPFRGDRLLAEEKRCELDRLYQRICDDLDALLHTIGLKAAA